MQKSKKGHNSAMTFPNEKKKKKKKKKHTQKKKKNNQKKKQKQTKTKKKRPLIFYAHSMYKISRYRSWPVCKA